MCAGDGELEVCTTCETDLDNCDCDEEPSTRCEECHKCGGTGDALDPDDPADR